jgi:hypothetical protein
MLAELNLRDVSRASDMAILLFGRLTGMRLGAPSSQESRYERRVLVLFSRVAFGLPIQTCRRQYPGEIAGAREKGTGTRAATIPVEPALSSPGSQSPFPWL